MIDAREPKANNCPVPCLFYTSHTASAAERSANFVLWDVLLTGATEEPRNFQTVWVCPRQANEIIVESLILHRTCMIVSTIQKQTI
jgi:hypothetical protein